MVMYIYESVQDFRRGTAGRKSDGNLGEARLEGCGGERDGTARADISRRSKTFAFLPARGNLRCAANVSLP